MPDTTNPLPFENCGDLDDVVLGLLALLVHYWRCRAGALWSTGRLQRQNGHHSD